MCIRPVRRLTGFKDECSVSIHGDSQNPCADDLEQPLAVCFDLVGAIAWVLLFARSEHAHRFAIIRLRRRRADCPIGGQVLGVDDKHARRRGLESGEDLADSRGQDAAAVV